MSIVLYPTPKINIGLRIVRKRPDGFHDIETLFYPVSSLHDILEIVPSSGGLELSHYGIPYAVPHDDMERELCVRAFRVMEREYGIPPVEMHLYKGIPVGAGLGGGSSDAAFTLMGLDRLFSLGLTKEKLASLAAEIGSDCPFFIYNEPMIGKGRGEILTPYEMDLSQYEIKVVTPNVSISTAEAYASVVPDLSGMDSERYLTLPVCEWKGRVVNDFEKSLFEKYPLLAEQKEILYREGALYASMSGSGSALFGIFPNPQARP